MKRRVVNVFEDLRIEYREEHGRETVTIERRWPSLPDTIVVTVDEADRIADGIKAVLRQLRYEQEGI